MLLAFADFVAVFSRTARLVQLPFTKKRGGGGNKTKKNTSSIYTENKIFSHGLYNWAYTLFTVQSRTKNIYSLSWQNGSPSLASSKAVTSILKLKHGLVTSSCSVHFQIKVHIFTVNKKWRWAKRGGGGETKKPKNKQKKIPAVFIFLWPEL